MAANFVLPPELYDVGWDALPKTADHGGLQFSQVPKLNEWIVKLQFKQGGKEEINYGTGFYINIPEATSYVILTAGHNLIDRDKNTSRDLVLQDPSGSEVPIRQEGKDFFIAASYRQNPSQSNARNDYGAILIPKESNSNPRGFGFALLLGHDNRRGNEPDLAVSGYQVSTDLGNPVTSTGKCKRCTNDQLGYDMKTDKGLSGSPVFMPYRGHETAVAIHNNGSERNDRGSKGTRLNEHVLEQIFDWVKVGYKNKHLRTLCSPPLPLHNLYLRFRPNQDCAWVRSGCDGLDTRFDIFPAYAPPATVENTPLSVFRFLPPQGWKRPKEERWVLWNPVCETVTLTKTLQEFCFLRMVPSRKKAPEAFYIVINVPRNNNDLGDLMELRMQATGIKEMDIEMGSLDTPEVSFAMHQKNKKVPFNEFYFE